MLEEWMSYLGLIVVGSRASVRWIPTECASACADVGEPHCWISYHIAYKHAACHPKMHPLQEIMDYPFLLCGYFPNRWPSTMRPPEDDGCLMIISNNLVHKYALHSQTWRHIMPFYFPWHNIAQHCILREGMEWLLAQHFGPLNHQISCNFISL